MARVAKLLIIASAMAGLAVQAWLGSREWVPLSWATAGAFVAGFALVRRFPQWGWAPVLGSAYIYPALFWATREFFTFAYYAIPLAGILGGTLACPRALHWHMPRAWRLPLAYWALVLAFGWPLVAARELNFRWAAMADQSLANSGLGGPPAVVIITMLLAVLPQMIGILWLDGMCAAFARERVDRFRSAILLPLAAGLVLSCALAIYQWQVDLEFLSSHQWPYYRRAAGGLLDGNASGQLFGLWSAAVLTYAVTAGTWQLITGLALVMATWLGVWATGSRMALLAALIGLAGVAHAALRGRDARISGWRILAGAGCVLTASVLLVAVVRSDTDPLSRIRRDLPAMDRASLAKFVDFQFWNRFGPFGTASVRMITDHPVTGVGAGMFEPLYVDYAYVVTNGKTRSHFDNAQSWYRHQLAELGLVGSAGWIVWGTVCAVFVWRAARVRDGLTEATGVRAALIALAVLSLISMPARNIIVSLSFWVFVFWLLMTGRESTGPRWLTAAADRRAAWLVVLIAAAAFTAGSAWYGYRHLRPPHRALLADWDYLNGISRPVTTEEGRVRFTDEEGTAVFYAAPGQYVRVAFKLPHPDAARAPVRVKLFQHDAQIASLLVRDTAWHELFVRIPERSQDRTMLTVTVDRPAGDAGAAARGLVLRDWETVAAPPPGAMIASTDR